MHCASHVWIVYNVLHDEYVLILHIDSVSETQSPVGYILVMASKGGSVAWRIRDIHITPGSLAGESSWRQEHRGPRGIVPASAEVARIDRIDLP